MISGNKEADRKANLWLAYLADKDVFPNIPFNLFVRLFHGWNINPILRNDLYIGVIFNRGNEIHVAILPEYRKRWAGKWFGALMKSYMIDGKVTTKVTTNDKNKLDFVLRLGWRIVGQIDQFTLLEMTEKDHNNVWNKTKA